MAGGYRTANSTAPSHGARAVTPSDATVIDTARSLYIGTTGNLTVRMADGQDNITFSTVPVGILPIQVDKVYSTGTTASNILALY